MSEVRMAAVAAAAVAGGSGGMAVVERRHAGATRARSPSHCARNKTPKDRVWEFGSVLGIRDQRLLCQPCNVALDHTRRSTIVEHLRSRKHFRLLARLEKQQDLLLQGASEEGLKPKGFDNGDEEPCLVGLQSPPFAPTSEYICLQEEDLVMQAVNTLAEISIGRALGSRRGARGSFVLTVCL